MTSLKDYARMDTPYRDKKGIRIRIGDLLYLKNWNHNLPFKHQDEIRVAQYRKGTFMLTSIMPNNSSTCSMEYINQDLTEIITKEKNPEYFL